MQDFSSEASIFPQFMVSINTQTYYILESSANLNYSLSSAISSKKLLMNRSLGLKLRRPNSTQQLVDNNRSNSCSSYSLIIQLHHTSKSRIFAKRLAMTLNSCCVPLVRNFYYYNLTNEYTPHCQEHCHTRSLR